MQPARPPRRGGYLPAPTQARLGRNGARSGRSVRTNCSRTSCPLVDPVVGEHIERIFRRVGCHAKPLLIGETHCTTTTSSFTNSTLTTTSYSPPTHTPHTPS